MMPSSRDQRTALEALIANPSDAGAAERIVELAVAGPDDAATARRAYEATPEFRARSFHPGKKAFELNNLRMPRPFAVRSPKTLAALVNAIREAGRKWRTMKGLGGAYAFSNAAFTDGFLIQMTPHLRKILQVPKSILRSDVDPNYLCRFEAGASIGHLNRHLWKKDLTLMNQPGFDELTYVGAATTGAHGSGIRYKPLADEIRSVHLITIDEDHKPAHVWLEPSDGISDPTKFARKYPEYELIQDDDLFASVIVGVGCLGVIYSVIVNVQDSFFIKETRTFHPWAKTRVEIPKLLARTDVHSISSWLNLYPVDGRLWSVLTVREYHDGPARGKRAFGIEYGGSKVLAKLLSWWVSHFPETTPALTNSALKATLAENVVMPCYEGLSFGDVNNLPVLAAGCAVPLDSLEPAADKLSEVMREVADSHRYYATGPVGLRFVAGGRGFLAPQYGRDTMMMELPIINGTPGQEQMLTAYLDAMYEHFDARPHWGQFNPFGMRDFRRIYPKIDKFVESYQILNVSGLFDNALTTQAGFRSILKGAPPVPDDRAFLRRKPPAQPDRPTPLQRAHDAMGGTTGPLGEAVGPATDENGARKQAFEGGSIVARADASVRPLKILAQNMALLVAPGVYRGRDRDASIRKLIEELSRIRPDIVGLSECFKDSERAEIRSAVRQFLPHAIDGPDESDLESDGGLLLLSAHPIIARTSTIFRQTAGEDGFANKGVVHARIRPHGTSKAVDVFVSHAQSLSPIFGSDASAWKAMQHQLQHIDSFIAACRHPERPALLMGDLNVDGRDPTEYGALITSVHSARDLWQEAHPGAAGITFDRAGTFHDGAHPLPVDSPQRHYEGKRLDYVLAFDGRRSFAEFADPQVVIFQPMDGVDLSDHYGVFAEQTAHVAFEVTLDRPAREVTARISGVHCLKTTGEDKSDEVQFRLHYRTANGKADHNTSMELPDVRAGDKFDDPFGTVVRLTAKNPGSWLAIDVEGWERDSTSSHDQLGSATLLYHADEIGLLAGRTERRAVLLTGQNAEYVVFVEVSGR